MSSESTDPQNGNEDKSDVPVVTLQVITSDNVDNTHNEDDEKQTKPDISASQLVPTEKTAIQLKEEEMRKRIAEMEERKAIILERIKKMEEIGAKAEKLRQEKLEKIAKAKEREALLKTEKEKLAPEVSPKKQEEAAILSRIQELEARKRAILDRIEQIEKIKSKGIEYKERAEKLRQRLEEKRQQQLLGEKKKTDIEKEVGSANETVETEKTLEVVEKINELVANDTESLTNEIDTISDEIIVSNENSSVNVTDTSDVAALTSSDNPQQSSIDVEEHDKQNEISGEVTGSETVPTLTLVEKQKESEAASGDSVNNSEADKLDCKTQEKEPASPLEEQSVPLITTDVANIEATS